MIRQRNTTQLRCRTVQQCGITSVSVIIWAPMTGLIRQLPTSAMVTLTPPGRHDREVSFGEELDRGQPVPEV